MNRLDNHHSTVVARMNGYHQDFIDQVATAIRSHKVVVVGMAWNPAVPSARRFLDAKGVAHHDIDHGNYIVGWRRRLALKIWAGWPTFPMVFIKGQLVGGASDLKLLDASGELDRLLKD
jgi:glutaredoxin-related protein